MRRRFKTCGNPKGRPKGARNRKTIVREVANEIHQVREDGELRGRSTLELVLLRLRELALEGKNTQAFEEVHRLIKAYEPQPTDDSTGVLVVPAEMSPEEWIAEQEELNKHRKKPEMSDLLPLLNRKESS